ncbi:MAG: neutral/alkaline non-lysosomal ceramidase N-terminal domain-containing protein, partial [FCB group bacterium]|nr:neutral/alkaline non-lysosomal ceramidase N-terminal domain-containing protein [FCB group bacterium]
MRFSLLVLIVACFGLGAFAQPAEPAPAPKAPVEEGAANDMGVFKAGAAKLEITPALGLPLNGYGDRQGRGATAVHDPLWVRCLCLDDGKTRVFLVNADLCLITPELRAAVLDLLPTGIARENVILTATHTHNGPGGTSRPLVFRLVSGRYVPELVTELAQKFSKVIQAAADASKPALVGHGTGEQDDLSTNRRHDEGPIDPQIGVLRIDGAQKQPIAIVTNFAAHPTSVPEEDHYSYSADYPGFYYQELEALAGEGCVAMFFNGAEGNQTCASPDGTGGWERTETVGRLLAERAKEIADGITCRDVKLHLAYATPSLP